MSNQNRATKLPVPNTDNVDRSVTNSLEKTKFSTMFGGGNGCSESPQRHNQYSVWHNMSASKNQQSHSRQSVSTTHQVMLSLDLEDIYNDEFNKMYDETPSRLYDDASPNSSSFNLASCMCEYNTVGEMSPHSPSAFLSNYSSSFSSSFSSGTMSPSSSPARSSSSDSLLIGKVDQTQPKKAPHRRHRSSVVDRKYSPYEGCFILTKPFHISTPESMAVELSCKEIQQQQRQKRGRPNHKELNPNG